MPYPDNYSPAAFDLAMGRDYRRDMAAEHDDAVLIQVRALLTVTAAALRAMPTLHTTDTRVDGPDGVADMIADMLTGVDASRRMLADPVEHDADAERADWRRGQECVA